MLLHYVKPDFVTCNLSICSLLAFQWFDHLCFLAPAGHMYQPPWPACLHVISCCLTNFWDFSLPLFFDLPFPTYTCRLKVSTLPHFLPLSMSNRHVSLTCFTANVPRWSRWCDDCETPFARTSRSKLPRSTNSQVAYCEGNLDTWVLFVLSGGVFLPSCFVLEGGKWKWKGSSNRVCFLKVGLFVCLLHRKNMFMVESLSKSGLNHKTWHRVILATKVYIHQGANPSHPWERKIILPTTLAGKGHVFFQEGICIS